jgi:hypothetical protein
MNKQLEEFIAQKKEKINHSKIEKRNKHLIELGLIDKSKTKREYYDAWNADPGLIYDETEKKYYIETPVPLEITDEEYDEVCKYCSTPTTREDNVSKNSEEGTLRAVATIILIGGIISSIVFLFATGSSTFYDEYGQRVKTVTNWLNIFLAFATLFASVVTWAVLRVISNISETLKEIKNKNN